MGNCATNACCSNGDVNEVSGAEVLIDRGKKLSPDQLEGGRIEIGENGFDSPLSRKALLQENYSHIYDRRFEQDNRETLIKLQSSIRCFVTLNRFKLHLKR